VIYIVTYYIERVSYVAAAFYDEEEAYAFVASHGRGYTVECFIGARKIW